MLELVITKMNQPTSNLVRCLIPLLLKQLYVVLGEGLINFRMLF